MTHRSITAECATLLRYFGVRAVIVDFPESGSRPIDRSSMTGKRSLWEYMRDATGGSSGGGVTEGGELQMADRLVSWVERYFTQTHTTCTAVSTTTSRTMMTDSHTAAATASSSTSSSSSSSAATSSSTKGGAAVSAAASHDTTNSAAAAAAAAAGEGLKYFRPPLYFQHQGHSRTITGRFRVVTPGAACFCKVA